MNLTVGQQTGDYLQYFREAVLFRHHTIERADLYNTVSLCQCVQ